MGLQASSSVLLCALVLLQLFCACRCLNGALGRHGMHHGDRKQALSKRALLDTGTGVLRGSLVRIDSGSNATASEKLLAAVTRSQVRVTQLQLNLQRQVQEQAATDLQSTVSPGSGEYVMQIALGTPPQQFSAIIDTGSDLIWLQCAGCTKCIQQPDNPFDSSASSTFQPATCTDSFCLALPTYDCGTSSTCDYKYTYGDQSFTIGELAYETVTLTPSSVPNIAFGCGVDNEGTFTNVDGLVGLGRGVLSFPSQISPGVANIFSYCLVQRQASNSGTSPITFGSSASNANVQYTPLVINPTISTFYYVQVTGVSVGSQAVTIPDTVFEISSTGAGGVLFDSGTTVTSWVTEAFDPILQAIQQQVTYTAVSAKPYGLTLCYDVSGVSSPAFPGLTIGMANNVLYEIPETNLWEAADSTGNTICLLLASAGAVAQSMTIIGNLQQQNVLIVYDGVNQQIGFEATTCSTLGS